MIVSTTLTGSSEEIIREALESAIDQVDLCLVIDTGVHDETIAVARDVCGDKLRVSRFAWRDDFAAARNHALRVAEELKADWAMTLDTDERMVFAPGFSLKKALSEPKSKVLLVQQADGSYCKERFFRLPTQVRFHGPTHEGLRGMVEGEILRGMTFSELEKTQDQLRIKNERDVDILTRHLKHEYNPRWLFHLGTALHGLHQYRKAIDAYCECADLRGWSEESSWACYRAAECACAMKQWIEAIALCARGLSLRPRTMELAWLAGWAAYQGGEYEASIAWCRIAISIGPEDTRVGFRNIMAQHEGPYEVLYYAHHALGHTAEAEDARQEWIRRKAARLDHEIDRRTGPSSPAAGRGGDGQVRAGLPA